MVHTNGLRENTQIIEVSESGNYSVDGGNSSESVENNYSMSFDGQNDYVQLSNNIEFGMNSFSISIDYCHIHSDQILSHTHI